MEHWFFSTRTRYSKNYIEFSYEDWVTKKQTTRRNSSVCLSISELPEQNNLKVKNGPTYDEWLKRKITYHRNSTASNDIEQIKLLLANRRDSVSSSNKNAESYDEWIKRKNKDRRNSSSLPDLSSDVQKASAGRRQSVNSHSHEGSSRKGLSHKGLTRLQLIRYL